MLFPAKDGLMRWNFQSLGRIITPAVVIIFFFLLPSITTAQTAPAKDWNKMGDTLEGAIGLHYGKLGGNGLSFRVPLRWFLYLQVGGGIWHSNDDQKHNLGVELNYILRQDAHVRLYLGGGLGYFYHRENVGGNTESWDKKEDWNTGAGVGIEYLLGQRVAVQGELNFVHESGDGEIKVAPQVGLHYYW